MARTEIDIDPVTRLTTDAIGKPGQRVFYLQGQDEQQKITLLIEKVQVQSLSIGVEQFLRELYERFPGLEQASGAYNEDDMHIEAPVEPLFRVGEIGLAYDSDRDLACLIANEILSEEVGEDDTSIVRFWCTRSQLLGLSSWGMDLSTRGRPICPQCGEPIDPTGHFCPKKNGHKH